MIQQQFECYLKKTINIHKNMKNYNVHLEIMTTIFFNKLLFKLFKTTIYNLFSINILNKRKIK
jgi:hypothetical protein